MDPVGVLVAAIAVYGAMGLVAYGLAERFIPVLPSSALLVAIGAASADGVWPLWVAIGATALGGMLGLSLSYRSLCLLGHDRARRIFWSLARQMGLPQERAEAWASRAHANTASLALALQLVPTVRFLAPALAIVAGMDQRAFLTASAFGMALWNGTFLGVGYAAVSVSGMTNVTGIALGTLAGGLVIQLAVLRVMRHTSGRRRFGDV